MVFRERVTIGEDNYRLSLCLRFTNKRLKNDRKIIAKFYDKYNLTNEINEKLSAMMVMKCQKELPINLTKKVGNKW